MRLAGPHALHDTSVAVAVMWFWWWDKIDSGTSAAQKERVEREDRGHDSKTIRVDRATFLFEAVRPLLLYDQRRGPGKASQRRARWILKCARIDRARPVPCPSQTTQEQLAAVACRSCRRPHPCMVTTTHQNDPLGPVFKAQMLRPDERPLI